MSGPQLVGSILGVTMVPVVVYALFQRLRYPKRRVTLKGVLVAAWIGGLIGYPSFSKEVSDRRAEAARAFAQSKPDLVAGCQASCSAKDRAAADCSTHCACVLKELEARYPTPDYWADYLQLAATNPIMAQTQALEASAACNARYKR